MPSVNERLLRSHNCHRVPRDICGFVQDGRALFSELIALAEEQPPKNLKEASFKIGHRMDLHRFVVPVQVRMCCKLQGACCSICP